jgi:hypothetical protein
MVHNQFIKDGACFKLCPCSFGVALAVTNALAIMYLGCLAMYFGFGVEMVNQIGSVYHGFAPTWTGIIYGGLWALVEGFIFGVIMALIYNSCARCCCGKSEDVVVEKVKVVKVKRKSRM